MRSVEIRLGSTEDGVVQQFEVQLERKKDDKWSAPEPLQVMASTAAPMVLYLEDNERVVITSKVEQYQIVFDRDQNANIVVRSDEENKALNERADVAKDQKQQNPAREPTVVGAPMPPMSAGPVKEPAKASAQTSGGTTVASGDPSATIGGPSNSQASQGAVDSKQVKK